VRRRGEDVVRVLEDRPARKERLLGDDHRAGLRRQQPVDAGDALELREGERRTQSDFEVDLGRNRSLLVQVGKRRFVRVRAAD
jgi:hypothetical protein